MIMVIAANSLDLSIHLDRIKCRDEADSWGDAEPYLWAVFFKIDGDTVRAEVATDPLKLKLVGAATVFTKAGSHGNLGTKSVDAGDNVTIPASVGAWQTTLNPIPVGNSPLKIPAIAGVIAILMEEDNVSDDGAEAGHQAMKNAIQKGLNQLIATRSLQNREITSQELAQLKADVQASATQAIKDEMGFFEKLWAALNQDDQIGDLVETRDLTQLSSAPTINFSKRFKNQGDWEIFGRFVA
jgi:hypothetical protein